jgi:hypothetical protein
LPEIISPDPTCTGDCEETLLPVSMSDTFPTDSGGVPVDNPEETVTWAPWSLTGEEMPDWPVWAACAGRHTIRMPSDRIITLQQNCLFIQVLYAEKLHKYNLIAAATCQHHQSERIRIRITDDGRSFTSFSAGHVRFQ